MSAREPLTAEERQLAERLAEWSVGAPSAQIEQRILSQARAAVAVAPARPAAGRRRPPWLLGLASAAVLTLAVGVVWRVVEAPSESAIFMESVPVAAPEPAPAVVGKSVQSDSLSVADSPMDRQLPETAAPGQAPERSAASAGRADGGTATVAPSRQRAPAAPAVAMPAPQALPVSPMRERSIAPPPSAGRVPEPEPSRMSPPAEPEPMVPPPPPSAPPAPPPPPPAPAAPVVEQALEAAPSLRSAPAREDSAKREAARALAPSRAQGTTDAAPERREEAYGDSADEHESADTAMEKADARFEREVVRIRGLLQRGEQREAMRSLQRLRQRFPLHALPEDLQALADRDGR